MARFYTTPDGTKYPLTEARYPMDVKIYRSDRRKAVANDPFDCLIARGIKRLKNVIAVYIGSGRDAYVVFGKSDDEQAHAVHFVINASTKRILDGFDQDKSAKTQKVTLCKPPKSWTLEGRRNNNARRRAEIKNGSPVKRRGKIALKRIQRLGVEHRQRAPLSETGNLNLAA